MKKLLFITWSVSFGYGTEKSLSDVLNRLDQTKYDISILPIFKSARPAMFGAGIQVLSALVDCTKEENELKAETSAYYDLLANPLAFNKRITESYDCVIACNHNAPSYLASYIVGGQKIVWIRGDMRELDYAQYAEHSTKYIQMKKEYEMQASVLKRFDTVVVISDAVAASVHRLFGELKNVRKIANSVDAQKILPLSEEEVTVASKPTFTSVGRLDSNKNHMLLLKAVVSLKRICDSFMLYILGDGAERAALEEFIRANDLSDCVEILGFVDNPYPYIRQSVATVLTSLSEGFALVLAESVVLNTPIISTNVGIAQELVDKYQCGAVIGYDEGELCLAMLDALTRAPGEQSDFGAENDFVLETEIEKTSAVIEETMAMGESDRYIRLPYAEELIYYDQLDSYMVRYNEPYVLRIKKDGVFFEYLINRKREKDKLIVFHNGAAETGNVRVPIFQRHSWAPNLAASSVYCMDPTLYLNGYLKLGWGIGKNQSHYLEVSSHILKKLIEKMEIALCDTVIYGVSGGGFLAIMMGVFLKGATVVADNPQLDATHWIYKDALDAILSYSFDNIGEALRYKERYSVAEAFEKHRYIPRMFLYVNMCSMLDNTTQLVPFLTTAETMRGIVEHSDMRITLRYSPEAQHTGLERKKTLEILYEALDLPADTNTQEACVS